MRQPRACEDGMESWERDAAGYVRLIPAGEIASGTGRTLPADGSWVALFNAGGTYYAVDNACPHQGGPLGAGRLDGTVVTCPLHGWRIDLTSGRCVGDAGGSVARYDVKEADGWVWVRVPRSRGNGDCTPRP
jgi:NAD(P)H-dependent nitrite reductase small subunit